MTIICDNKKRVTLPGANPGDAFDVSFTPAGAVILTKLKPIQRQAHLIKRKGRLLLTTDEPITFAETRRAMDEFP